MSGEKRGNTLRLRITGPDGRTNESVAESDSVILGSGAGAAIQIQDPRVSNLHVMLKVEKSGVVKAIDLGSEHGTCVGDTAIEVPTALRSGDVIHLGASKVEVLFGAAANAAPNPLGDFEIEVSVPAAPPARPAPVAARPSAPVPPGMRPMPRAMTAAPRAQAPRAPAVHATGASQVLTPGSPAQVAPPAMARAVAPEALASSAVTARAGSTALKLDPTPSYGPLPIEAAPTGENAPRPQNAVLQVAMVWGNQILGISHFGEKVPVTVGSGKKTDFNVFSDAVGESFELARSEGNKLTVKVPQGANLTLFQGKRPVSSASRLGADRTVSLGLEERAKVTLDQVSFLLRHVSPSAAVPVKKLADRDFAVIRTIGLVMVMGIAAFVALSVIPHNDSALSDVNNNNDNHYVKLLIKKAPPPAVVKQLQKAKQKSGAEEGAKAKDDEGKFGKVDEKQQVAAPSKPGTPMTDQQRKEKDRQKVMKTGLLGAGAGALSNLLGPGGKGSGINDALGGLTGGAAMGNQRGVGGLGSRGSGTGGGGAGLGLGGLGTRGNGLGAGGNGIDLGGRGKDITKIIPGKTIVVGGLSREAIEKVIRAHQAEIKYCYETELQKNPELAGKVSAAWVIGPDGSVQDANVAETSMNNGSAEQCMITRIKRWKFPEPQGGGVVSVTFPWIFKPAGGGN